MGAIYTDEQGRRVYEDKGQIFDASTAENLGPADTKPQPSEQDTEEPTTIYSGTVEEDIAPKLDDRLKVLTDEETPEEKLLREEKEGLEKEAETIEAGTYQDDTTKLLDQMKGELDRQTQAEISRVQNQYSQYIRQQEDINKRMEASTSTALLLGGASRYSVSSTGIIQAQISYGQSKISELRSQEQELIAAARSAQTSGNFQIMAKKIEHAEGVRERMQKEAKALGERLAKINNEQREKTLQSVREQAIAGLVEEGVTTHADIQFYLNQIGIDASLDEIDKVLKITNPPESLTGLQADLTTAKYIFDNPNLFPEMKGFSILDIRQALKNKEETKAGFELRSAGGDLLELEKDEEGRVIGTRVVAKGREPKGTEGERKRGAIADFSSAFTSGAVYEGRDVIGEDGFMDPQVWKAAIADAPDEGVSRKEFIQEFGHFINTTSQQTLKEYGLTPTEIRLITGELGVNEEEDLF